MQTQNNNVGSLLEQLTDNTQQKSLSEGPDFLYTWNYSKNSEN